MDPVADLAQSEGARRYTADGPLYVAEGSPAHEEYESRVAAADEAERENLLSAVRVECGEGSPTHDRLVRGLASVSPPARRADQLRSIGDKPPRPPTRGEREMGQREPIGNVRRYLERHRDSRVIGRIGRVHLGRSRERRAAPRRRGSRRGTGTGSRAGPPDSDPDDPEPPGALARGLPHERRRPARRRR